MQLIGNFSIFTALKCTSCWSQQNHCSLNQAQQNFASIYCPIRILITAKNESWLRWTFKGFRISWYFVRETTICFCLMTGEHTEQDSRIPWIPVHGMLDHHASGGTADGKESFQTCPRLFERRKAVVLSCQT